MNCNWCKIGYQNCGNPSSRVILDGIPYGIIRCNNCSLCVGLQMAEGWRAIDQILSRESQIDGFYPANTTEDKVVHYILRQLLYNEHENSEENEQLAVFDAPDKQDVVMLLWQNGTAVGFYTLKSKGTWIEETGELYAFTTLDTIFVHKVYRRRGHSQKMLEHICTSCSDEDIGISKPISSTMKAALHKFLTNNPHLRNKLWEVDGTGGEGYRKLVWFILSIENRNKCRTQI